MFLKWSWSNRYALQLVVITLRNGELQCRRLMAARLQGRHSRWQKSAPY